MTNIPTNIPFWPIPIFLILCESSDRFWLCQLHDLSNFRLSCRWVAVISRTFMVPGCSDWPKTTFRKRPLLVDDISLGGPGVLLLFIFVVFLGVIYWYTMWIYIILSSYPIFLWWSTSMRIPPLTSQYHESLLEPSHGILTWIRLIELEEFFSWLHFHELSNAIFHITHEIFLGISTDVDLQAYRI